MKFVSELQSREIQKQVQVFSLFTIWAWHQKGPSSKNYRVAEKKRKIFTALYSQNLTLLLMSKVTFKIFSFEVSFYHFTEVVKSQFNTLINCELFDAIRTKFCLCHIAIPALEADSAAVQTGCYPSMDQMAEMIPFVRFFDL